MSEDGGTDPGSAGTDRGMLDSMVWRFRPGRRRSRLRWLLTGERPEPRPGCIGLYEQPEPSRDDVGICCSGGGVRSAAFNLGALQVLQSPEHQVLQRSKYLAAVSGGSYIAAAFCMVAKTWSRKAYPPGERPVRDDDGGDDSDPGLVNDDALPFEAGSEEEQYLRNHLSYLAPDGMARLHLMLRMLAGLLVNVLLIGLPVLIVGLVAGWIARVHYGDLKIDPAACIRDKAGKTVCHYALDVPSVVWAIVAALTLLAFACAFVGVIWRPRHDSWRAAIETWEVRFFVLGLAAAVVLVLVPWLAARALALGDVSVHGAAARSGVAAVSSVAALFAAALGHVRGRVRDEQKALAGVTKRLGKYAKAARDALIAGVVMLAGPMMLVAICVLGVLVAVITAPADATNAFAAGPLGDLTPGFTAWLVLSVLLLAALWLLVDLTSVSLHPFYRRRLATAFALKRVWIDENEVERAVPPAGKRAKGRVVARQRSFDKIVELTKSGVEPGCCAIKSWPMLVICAAANVSDPGATPPGRAVASFTFSPTAIGGPVTAAAPTVYYEHDLGRNRRRDVTLPAAVAMSGAALAPRMGKLTYRPITFLLGLANIRLGVWVPNPAHINARHRDTEDKESASSAPANDRDVRQRTSGLSPRALSPRSKPVAQRSSLLHRPRPQYLWKEVFGRNRLEDKFLYVTDGGHYENLGLVELLRRGCRTIYCFDAGGGSSSRELADAIALARTELNVDIEMHADAAALAEDPHTHRAERCCVRGRIIYPATETGRRVEGTLFYARSVIDEHAPWELHSFQETDPTFPHHSTFDQFFDDQKFEAYRLLGKHAAEAALRLERMHRRAWRSPGPAGNGSQPPDASSNGHAENGLDGAAQPAARKPSTPAEVHAMAVIRQFPGITVERLQATLGDADVYGVVGGLARAGQIRRTGGSGGGGVLTPRR